MRIYPDRVVEGDRAATLAHAAHTEIGTALILGRTRYNEDLLETAIRHGVTQYVILGAGFDTFALRRPDLRDRVQIFEIDHPMTQRLKQQRVRDAGLAEPANVHYVPVDFEVESLADGLGRSAYDASQVTCFSWLGVIGYLSRPAVEDTFRAIRGLAPPGSTLVFDYLDALAFIPEHQSLALTLRFAHAHALGEPYVTGFQPLDLPSLLGTMGYRLLEDLGPSQQAARYFQHREDGICQVAYWHWAHARLV